MAIGEISYNRRHNVSLRQDNYSSNIYSKIKEVGAGWVQSHTTSTSSMSHVDRTVSVIRNFLLFEKEAVPTSNGSFRSARLYKSIIMKNKDTILYIDVLIPF
jgi:hypothetical protein